MKKIVISLAALIVAASSIGSVSAYAEEKAITERGYVRSDFCQNTEGSDCGFRFGMKRKTELTEEEKAARFENIRNASGQKPVNFKIAQEENNTAISNNESGSLAFRGNKFAAMKGITPKNMENFKPDKSAFDGKNLGEMKEKLADLTEEEKSEIKEKFAENNISARKPKAFKRSNCRMMSGKRTPIEEEQ